VFGLFAGLNLLRVGVMRKTGLKDFEFSQNYMMFWDKLERANYFLEAIIETATRGLDDRTVAFLLESDPPLCAAAASPCRALTPASGADHYARRASGHPVDDE
jgi:hypothetical protein